MTIQSEFTLAFNNTQDIMDNANIILTTGEAIFDGVKSIGKAFNNPIGSLKGAFGW